MRRAVAKVIEKSLEQGLFFICLRETTSGDLSKGSLEAVLIHLLSILCAWAQEIQRYDFASLFQPGIRRFTSCEAAVCIGFPEFSMESVDVVTHAHQQEIGSDTFLSPHQESSESAIFFYHAKGAFNRNEPIHSKENSFGRCCFSKGGAVVRGKGYEFFIYQ